MGPANFQALRRLLFFTSKEAAQFIAASPLSEQQWLAWENGVEPIPEDIVQRILMLVDWRATALAAMADTIRQQIKDKGIPESIFILWYDRREDWISLPGREPAMWRVQQAVCAALTGMFQTVCLVSFDVNAYTRWLNGREDTESMRTEWASLTG
jgi:Domain of unknown function (DUF1870).